MEPKFIDRTAALAPEYDYKLLRSEYIAMLESMAGENWTDFNAHDPGVTILEHLCYGLTELGYKTDYPLTDILEEARANRNRLSDSFYTPNEIFHSSPVTVNDFRKTVADQFNDSIKNVWLNTVEAYGGAALGGCYDIIVQPADELYDKPDQLAKLKRDIMSFLQARRNLCESFGRVIFTEPVDVYLEGRIDIDPDADQDKILGNIFHRIDQILSPDIEYNSLFKMQAEGCSIEEIFEGPRLKNGFIRDQDLRLPRRFVHVSKLLKVVLQVPGVQTISSFRLVSGGRKTDTYLAFDEHTCPLLRLNLRDPLLPALTIFKSDIETRHSSFAVHKEIEYLKARKRRVFALTTQHEQNLGPDRGRFRKIADYHTIQNEFPLTYGIGRFGLPASASQQRRAQALQLKSYLLVFEQVMANYLAQLGNVNRLFSFSGKWESTYFTQPLSDMTDMDRIFRKVQVAQEDENGEISVEAGYMDGEAQYASWLREIVTDFENVFERKNRAFDHLLARFGEKFNETILKKLGHYFSKDGARALTLIIKSEFLKQVCELTAARGKAGDHNVSSAERRQDHLSVFEKRLRLLLGILDQDPKNSWLLNKYNINPVTSEGAEADMYFAVDERESGALHSLKYLRDESNGFVYYEEETGKKPDMDVFSGRNLDKDFFVNGIHMANYCVRVRTFGEDEEHFDLLFLSPLTGKYRHIQTYEVWDRLVNEVKNLVSFLKSLQIGTEGLRVVEHNLLVPPLHEEAFTFELRDESGRVIATCERDLNYDAMNAAVQRLCTGHLKVVGSAGMFRLELEEETAEREIVFPQWHATRAAAQDELYTLQNLISAFQAGNGMPLTFLARMSDRHMDLGLFSFRMTVVLPALSARFNDAEFRKLAEQVMRENVPAHIYVHVRWLEMPEYERFEELRTAWQRVRTLQGLGDIKNSRAAGELAGWIHQSVNHVN